MDLRAIKGRIMKIDCQFKRLDRSDSLALYIEEKLQSLSHFEMKPLDVHVIFSAERHLKNVEIHIIGRDVSMIARGSNSDFYVAADQAVDKLSRQMHKRKRKIQQHRTGDDAKRRSGEVSARLVAKAARTESLLADSDEMSNLPLPSGYKKVA